MLFQIIIVLLLLLISLISDIKSYKIKNSITLTFALLGLAVNSLLWGIEGIKFSLLGWIVPIAFLFVFFALRMLGAGDIKLFGAIGAVMGTSFVFYSILYSFVFGGVIALVLIFRRRNASKRFEYLIQYFKNCILTLKLQDYGEFENKAGEDKFRFSYAVVPGTLTQLLINLLHQCY